MAKYTFVVLTNAVEGKDNAFDEWYTDTSSRRRASRAGFCVGSAV